MTHADWKTQTIPLLVALMSLEDKAQDNGLTEREKAVHDVLELRYQEVLRKLLRGKR